MINMLKTLWNNLFNKQPVVVDQEVHPLPTEIEESKPVTKIEEPTPVKQTRLEPNVSWPFPTDPKPEAKPLDRKRRSPRKKVAAPAPTAPVKKSAKEIAADRRKAAASADRNRAKGKKTK